MLDFMIFALAMLFSYYAESEFFIFAASIIIMVRFLIMWYKPVLTAWPKNRGKTGKIVLGALPALALAIILAVLRTMAAFDVVGFWVLFYLLIGFAWMSFSVYLMEKYLDLFRAYDIIHLGNKAAIFPVAAGFIGLTCIYAGANIGDGPGWWVVFIAGAIGAAAWVFLAYIISATSRASERITVDRDVACGVRFGAYLLASGIILARASGGDWTSFWQTILEFGVGWPVLPLALLALIVEQFYMRYTPSEQNRKNHIGVSVFLGCVYVAWAIVSLAPVVSSAVVGG